MNLFHLCFIELSGKETPTSRFSSLFPHPEASSVSFCFSPPIRKLRDAGQRTNPGSDHLPSGSLWHYTVVQSVHPSNDPTFRLVTGSGKTVTVLVNFGAQWLP